MWSEEYLGFRGDSLGSFLNFPSHLALLNNVEFGITQFYFNISMSITS